ncbi:MAG TPA: RagB/SusD family nutrient uptake outer membrane protein [Phnomibacter sp.]|nr:RagB/SusD family nutrient uptake outer membrane protein [Phnomibacter sp.]
MLYKKSFFIIAISVLAMLQGCEKALDLQPTNDITGEIVFASAAGYKKAMAKMYAGMAVTGSPGRDIPSEIVSDEGSTGFLRQLWYLQCLSTDEAGWTYSNNTDPLGIHQMTWSASNQAVAGLYYRCFYNITLCNNFLQESTDDKLSSRGISGADADMVRTYRDDARFLRAYNYWILLDNFGSVPFSDETAKIGSGNLPHQISKTDLFNYLESELKAIETTLPAPRATEYGRADKGAAWALLARMYLNAQVYTGTAKYTEAITYSSKVINGGYTLHANYKELMLADNHDLGKTEFIWAILYDGTNTQAWSGTTFLVHGPAGVPGSTSGTNGTWNCMRITEQFVDKFGALDIRGQFWTTGQTKPMDVLLGLATSGYSSTKFTNKTRSGGAAPHADASGDHTDVDFPVFRLAEMYLIYAEAVVRGGTGGSTATATGYLQALARRGRPADPNANAFVSLTLPYILDERGRELFWECHRRTDLIRYNQFTTGTYLWSWKGDVRNGTAVDPKYNIYPIPAIDLSSNPNIKQNAGY